MRHRAIISPEVAPLLRSLLLDRGSLTRRLIALCHGRFRVQLDAMRWTTPLVQEARAIHARTRAAVLVREVTLMCNERPTVYARSIIPRRALQGHFRSLRHLGTRSLGELLFSDHRIRRGQTRYFDLHGGNPLHAAALARAPIPQRTFWGRSSLFYIGRQPLLVTEIFLTGHE